MMDGTPSETVIRRRGTSFHADDEEEGEVGDIDDGCRVYYVIVDREILAMWFVPC